MPAPKTTPIAIVGAGVFGLSTALALAERGYTNVTVFDKQDYDESKYSYFAGCDAASADASKIIRSAYGGQKEYTALSSEALALWSQWNDDSKDRVWTNNGVLMATDKPDLTEFEKASAQASNTPGEPPQVLITNSPDDIKTAEERGLSHAMKPFAKDVVGILDTTGGVISADKACLLALSKAKAAGAKFVLGPKIGAFSSFVREDDKVTGIKTADNTTHDAEIVIMACGGWTPSLLPAMDGLCETTAGSVLLYKIPEGSPLRERFSAANFPAWMFKQREGVDGGLYGFPVDHDGVLKIGYRGIKYTNPQAQADGKDRSVPKTRWTEDAITQVPAKAKQVITKFVADYLPELAKEDIGIWRSRLCWYTDSFDNHYVVDWVPDLKGVMVATGGSGHAFKYLPNIGRWVADIMEGTGLDRELVQAWKWRKLADGQAAVNKLMLGKEDSRTLENTELVSVDEAEAANSGERDDITGKLESIKLE